MAFASIIASAIGILLLIITAYVLVGGVLTTTQIAMNAQSEMTAVHMQMLGTSITVDSTSVQNGTPDIIFLTIRNSGSEQIDLAHTDVFLWPANSAPFRAGTDTWEVDPPTIQWRPTAILNMSVEYDATTYHYPVRVQITTGNGVSAITKVTAP